MQSFAQRGVDSAQNGLIEALEDKSNAQHECRASPGSRRPHAAVPYTVWFHQQLMTAGWLSIWRRLEHIDAERSSRWQVWDTGVTEET